MRLLVTLLCTLALAPLSRAQRVDAVQRFHPQQDVGIDQNLGAQVPLDLEFRESDGRTIALRECFRGRPVVLSLVYYDCEMMCTLVLNDQVRMLRALPLELGRDFDVVTVSIDARETPQLAQAKKELYLEHFSDEATPEQRAGWHFLTGSEESIRALSQAVGFRYVYDESVDEFAHAAGLMIASPDGVLTRYFYGIAYEPKDVRFALVEAGEGRVGSLADQVLLLCFHYDPLTGRYGFAVLSALRAGGLVVVALLVGFVWRQMRRERALRRAEVRP